MALNYGFTARDTELLGGSRYADPLGIGPVWSNLARRVVPNLTNQTNRGEGFQLLVCAVDLYERHRADKGDAALPFRDFYIVLEQAFSHSAYRYGKLQRWRLPGSRVVRNTSGHAKIGLGYQLLDAQFGGGTWGLYAAAAQRSRLIHMDPPSLTPWAREAVRSGYGRRSLSTLERDLFRGVAKGVRDSHAIHRAQWTVPLARIIEALPHRALLRQLIIEEPQYATPLGFPQAGPALLAEVARRIRAARRRYDETEQRRPFLRVFVENCVSRSWDERAFGQAARIFRDILDAESFLAPLAELFDALFAFPGRSPADVAAQLTIPTEELARARDAFRRLGYWSETARGRAALYCELDCSSGARVVEGVIDFHTRVAAERRRHPWLLCESGRITPLVDQPPNPSPELSPGEAWRNSYYLWSLLGLAEDFDVD